MISRSQRIKRGFQWLGVVLAAALLVVGLILITFDVLELDPWHVQQQDTPAVISNLLLGALGLSIACMALWALVQALGWVVVRMVRRYETH
jgi:hypothetical protein